MREFLQMNKISTSRLMLLKPQGVRYVIKTYMDETKSPDFLLLLPPSEQRHGEQSEDKGTDKPDGPESHNGLLC